MADQTIEAFEGKAPGSQLRNGGAHDLHDPGWRGTAIMKKNDAAVARLPHDAIDSGQGRAHGVKAARTSHPTGVNPVFRRRGKMRMPVIPIGGLI